MCNSLPVGLRHMITGVPTLWLSTPRDELHTGDKLGETWRLFWREKIYNTLLINPHFVNSPIFLLPLSTAPWKGHFEHNPIVIQLTSFYTCRDTVTKQLYTNLDVDLDFWCVNTQNPYGIPLEANIKIHKYDTIN